MVGWKLETREKEEEIWMDFWGSDLGRMVGRAEREKCAWL